jgi:hypothetical protein
MEIDAQRLSQHYASMSDQELMAVDRNELTDIAAKCYDWEIKKRGISFQQPETSTEATTTTTHWTGRLPTVKEPDDEETFIATTFSDMAGSDADEAVALLKAAGIPARVDIQVMDPQPYNPKRITEYQVLVPSALGLEATSVLDKEFFNPTLEQQWKTDLASLSDEDLSQLNVDALCAGFLDRAARIRKAYLEEVARRRQTKAQAGS